MPASQIIVLSVRGEGHVHGMIWDRLTMSVGVTCFCGFGKGRELK